MNNIIVPTDFSNASMNAMKYAMHLAKDSGATLHVITVIYPNEGVNNNVYNAFLIDDYIDARKAGLETWVKRFKKMRGFSQVKINYEVLVGFPASTIIEKANSAIADLILMATKGSTSFAKSVLGSVAINVLKNSNVPVMLVPPTSNYNQLGRFAFATDFNIKPGSVSLRELNTFINAKQKGLHVVHIVPEGSEKPNKAAETKIEAVIETSPLHFHYIHDNDIVQALSNFLEVTESAGLICIAHHHNWIAQFFSSSTTPKIANHVKVPLLVVYDK